MKIKTINGNPTRMLENEVFVDAKTFKEDYSGLYLVSNFGRCWSIRNKKFIGYWKDGYWHNGYWTVGLSKNGKTELMMIGRLALISFNIPIPEHLQGLPTSKLQAMHLDGDSKNNNLSNFAWGDANENNNEINARIRQSEAHRGVRNHRYGKHHSEETKRKIGEAMKGKNSPMLGKYGKDNPNSKPVIQYSKDGTFIRDWGSIIDVERELGIYNSSIIACAKGKRKSAGGYIWKYKEVA